VKLPYKINIYQEAATIFIIALCVFSSFYFYSKFPDQVPSHWNFAGEIDDYSSKGFAAFFFPALVLGIYILLTFIPCLDPKKERYADFSKAYNILRLSITLLMAGIYAIISINGIGITLPVGKIMPISIGFLFVIIGNFLPKVRQNWFVGIRTPWTLSSEEVWNKTHRFGGKAFVVSGLAMILLSAIEQEILWGVIFGGIMFVLIFGTIGYSWFLHKKATKKQL